MAGGVLVLGVGAFVWLAVFRGDGGESPGPAARHRPRCDTAKLHGKLGVLAWIKGSSIQYVDLDRCRDGSHWAGADVAPPIRFSQDGAWIAFGSGSVIPAPGRHVRKAVSPMGEVSAWAWSPSDDRLAGVTRSGRVLVATPEGEPETVVPAHAQSLAWSPDGRLLAVGMANKVGVVDAAGGVPRTLYVGPKEDVVDVVGWAPGGKWVLFFQRSPKEASAPLDAAPVSGAGYHNVFDPVLPFDDFLSWCGETLVLSGGGDRFASEGQQLLTSTAPTWRTHNLSRDFRSSWIWPTCSPDGARIAVTLTPNHVERPPGEGRRSVWVLNEQGTKRRRLAGAPSKVFEAPRWSADGRFVMVIQRARPPGSPGQAILALLDPKTMKLEKTVGPVATLTQAKGELGHLRWSAVSDWYRPPP